MRRFAFTFISLGMMLLISGCADLMGNGSKFEDQSITPEIYNILVASSRKREDDGSFGTSRSLTLSYGAYQISVPKMVRAGYFTYPQISTNPKRAYNILSSKNIANAEKFNKAVVSETFTARKTDEVTIFVHGFNSNFEKTVFRVAKIDADFETKATTLLYAWPSAIELGLYLHDMDSAAFARDGLEELLSGLANSKVKKITLVGHSMGASIIVETLRQISFKGDKRILNKIEGVALLSADMAVDLFVEYINDIKDLPQPFVIYSSNKDNVLRDFANFFHDGKERLGNITDFSPLAGLEVIVIDSSNIHDTMDSYHMAAASSPRMIGLINSTPKVGFASFGQYAKLGKVEGKKIIDDGSLVVVSLGD